MPSNMGAGLKFCADLDDSESLLRKLLLHTGIYSMHSGHDSAASAFLVLIKVSCARLGGLYL